MEPLTLQLPHGDAEAIECWDDDDDLLFNEDLQFRAASTATSVTNSSVRRSGHRDSISSRFSARSDLDSAAGGDEEDWQVQLLENDERANEEAISSAKNAGIPLPTNVPKSALLGGTIKRLGRRKPRKNMADDWSEDVELPDSECLKMKDPNEQIFPESLRHINSTVTSPVKCSPSPFWGSDISERLFPALAASLDLPRDENDEIDTQDVPTIKLPKAQASQRATPIQHGLQLDTTESNADSLDFDQDFEFPADNLPLNLPTRKTNTATSSPFPDDFDIDWSEGSIGVRFGGTARDRRSNPSSSVSVASPSVSSCLTGESEDDGLDGLVIPEEPLDLETSLKKRQDSKPSFVKPPSKSTGDPQGPAGSDDFFCDLDVEGGNVFTSSNLALNPNVKCKTKCPESPARRSATTITFTNTNASPKTRIPRPSGHDRNPLSTHLETVSESGAPISNFQRSPSRSHTHSAHSSVSSIPTSGASSTSPTPKFSSRRLVGTRVSRESLAGGRIPSGQQPLKSKRSMPTMRGMHQANSVSSPQTSPFNRDSSRQVSASTVRLKAPIDRVGHESRTVDRRTPAPFIPAGTSGSKSQHTTVKSNHPTRRANSESLGEAFHPQGAKSRITQNNASPDAVAPKRALTKPARRRNFGDGTELELFDDLPTSTFTESRFVKHPTGRGAPRSLRNRLSQSQVVPPRVVTPTQPPTPVTAPKTPDSTPRFARDTNASRNAREQRIASMTMTKGRDITTSLPSLSATWKPKPTSRVPTGLTTRKNRKGKSTVPGTKPHLIKPMGAGVQESKCRLSLIPYVFFLLGANFVPLSCQWHAL